MSKGTRLLLVEDDLSVGRMLQSGLSGEGYIVEWARSLREAVAAVGAATPQIIVLDGGLPDGDGVNLAAALRAAPQSASIPICMLTARDALEDKARSFEAGVDDYLVKPFEFEELLMRLGALMRRAVITPPTVALSEDGRSLQVGRDRIDLTPREAALMKPLLGHLGEAVSRADLMRDAWGEEAEVTPNTVDVYVGYLRRKLAEHPEAPKIEAVRGVGYRLALRASLNKP